MDHLQVHRWLNGWKIGTYAEVYPLLSFTVQFSRKVNVTCLDFMCNTRKCNKLWFTCKRKVVYTFMNVNTFVVPPPSCKIVLDLIWLLMVFWGCRFEWAFFDIRGFNPSNWRSSLQVCYRNHENVKRKAYDQRIEEIEHENKDNLF